MKLKKYLPDFINGIREFQELDATLSQEFDLIHEHLKTLQDNQFIETATSQGISRYEEMLNIKPNDDLEVRRLNILNHYNSTIPFTMKWLESLLNTTVGLDLYLIDLEPSHYTLTISIIEPKAYTIPTLQKELRRKIPANMVLNINILNPIESQTNIAAYLRTYDQYNI